MGRERAEVHMTTLPHSKVHEVQFAHADVLLSVLAQVTAFHCDCEYDMRPGGVVVHVCHCKVSW